MSNMINGRQGMFTLPWHWSHFLIFRGCCPMHTESACVSLTFLTIFTLVSLILVYLGNFVIIYWRPFCNLHIWGLKNQNTDGQTPYLDLGHISMYINGLFARRKHKMPPTLFTSTFSNILPSLYIWLKRYVKYNTRYECICQELLKQPGLTTDIK